RPGDAGGACGGLCFGAGLARVLRAGTEAAGRRPRALPAGRSRQDCTGYDTPLRPEPPEGPRAMIRTDWTMAEAQAIHALPFPDLLHRAQTTHRAHFDPTVIETASLLSIKTGGCPEDCGYCSQSAHHDT